MISMIAGRIAQSRATAVQNQNQQGRINTATKPYANDCFVRSAKSKNEAQPMFKGGIAMKFEDLQTFMKLQEIRNRIAEKIGKTMEQDDLAEILGEKSQVDPKDIAKDYFEMAKTYIELGKDNPLCRYHAYTSAMQSTQLDKNNPEVHFFLGGLEGMPHDALEHFSEAVRQKPYEPKYLLPKAAYHGLLGHHDKEIQVLDRLVSIQPKDDMHYRRRGFAYGRKGDMVAAERDYLKAAELNPDNVNVRSSLAMIAGRRGDDEASLKWLNEAEKAYRKVMNNPEEVKRQALAPDDLAKICSNRGTMHLNGGNLKDALDDFSMAIDITPNHPEAHYNRALTHLCMGNDAAALKDIDKVIDVEEPASLSLHSYVHLVSLKAVTLRHMDKHDESKKLIDEAQIDFPQVDFEEIVSDIFRTKWQIENSAAKRNSGL